MTVILELSRAGSFFMPVSSDSAGSPPAAGDLGWSFSAILSKTGISVCWSTLHVTTPSVVREGFRSDERIERVVGCSLGTS